MLHAGGTSRAAALTNSVLMALLVTVAAPIVPLLPLLAVGVALAMVAVQMIHTEVVDDIWRPAYLPQATPAQIQAAWRFWAIVLLAVGSSSK